MEHLLVEAAKFGRGCQVYSLSPFMVRLKPLLYYPNIPSPTGLLTYFATFFLVGFTF